MKTLMPAIVKRTERGAIIKNVRVEERTIQFLLFAQKKYGFFEVREDQLRAVNALLKLPIGGGKTTLIDLLKEFDIKTQ